MLLRSREEVNWDEWYDEENRNSLWTTSDQADRWNALKRFRLLNLWIVVQNFDAIASSNFWARNKFQDERRIKELTRLATKMFQRVAFKQCAIWLRPTIFGNYYVDKEFISWFILTPFHRISRIIQSFVLSRKKNIFKKKWVYLVQKLKFIKKFYIKFIVL